MYERAWVVGVFGGAFLKRAPNTERRDMIARVWRGAATKENADAYRRHATQNVFPELAGIDGHRGAFLLARESSGEVEFIALTLWDSIEAVKRFAGANPDVAVVEPEAKAVLSNFDDFVRHYDVHRADV
jgi:heme-degrading monooxygenase HmoA